MNCLLNCLLFLKQHISLFLASFFAIIFWSVLVVEKKFNFQNGIGAFILSAALFVSFFFSWKIIKKYSEEKKIGYILYSTILIFNCCWLIACFRVSSIAWDTWNMYDMSRYVFSDFGYMDNIRQHIINTHYEMAFPPLFPILMAVVNFIFDCGASAATFVCGIFSIWIVSLSALVGKKVGGILPFALCAFVFLCGSCYCWLVKTGISQVLNFAFLFLIVNLLLNFKLNIKNVVSLAFFSSLGLMCRFDFLAVVVVCFTFVTINALREKKIKETLKYSSLFALTTLLFCSPLIIYSIKQFNKFFVTDNGRRLINVVDTRAATFFPETIPVKTLFNDFWEWLPAFFERFTTSCIALIKCLVLYSVFFETILTSLLILLLAKFMQKDAFIMLKQNKNISFNIFF
ncbi:MAG: hypothetical protein J6W96_03005, partial [Alphaproteobacteria bacterium]|nr:hypothetical protein [Alphaproteobacteria bacterium]